MPLWISLHRKQLEAHPLRVGLSTTVDVDFSRQAVGVLGVVAPAAPACATSALHQQLQQARLATDAIVAKNMLNRALAA